MSEKKKKKILTKEEVSEFLKEDRNRVNQHIKSFEDMVEDAKTIGDKNRERELFLYFGSRTVKMLELLLKGNETMIKFLDHFGESDEDVPEWETLGEDDVEPATLDKSVFGD